MYPYAATKKTLQLDWSPWHPYNEAEVKKYAPYASGVYVLAVELTDGKNVRVFYGGQTDDLDRRLKEHLAASEKNACIKGKLSGYVCHFRYAKVETQSDRNKAERALYRKFTPSCNDPSAIPDVEDVEINF